jgi:hypothetical protein
MHRAAAEGPAARGDFQCRAKERAIQVFRARAARLAAVVSAAVVATMMFAGVATASPPNWVMTVTKLPGTGSPGAPVGYQVVITNNGPSNISQLFLVDKVGDSLDVPTAYVNPTQGSCNPTGPLFCAFGALNAGASVTTLVGYNTAGSASSFSVTFEGNTSGATFTDVKGRSHGDLLLSDPVVTTTALSNNKNFGGFFSTNTTHGVGNSDVLNGNNRQSTRLGGVAPGLAGTVEDGSLLPDACTTDLANGIDCSLVDGETSVITVGSGGVIPGGFFVVIHYKNGSTPTAFVHTYGSGQQEKINACADPNNPVPQCFTWDPATTTATLYLTHNGTVTKLH